MAITAALPTVEPLKERCLKKEKYSKASRLNHGQQTGRTCLRKHLLVTARASFSMTSYEF